VIHNPSPHSGVAGTFNPIGTTPSTPRSPADDHAPPKDAHQKIDEFCARTQAKDRLPVDQELISGSAYKPCGVQANGVKTIDRSAVEGATVIATIAGRTTGRHATLSQHGDGSKTAESIQIDQPASKFRQRRDPGPTKLQRTLQPRRSCPQLAIDCGPK